MRPWQELTLLLAAEPAVLVRVAEVQGSGPREVGAWMAVGRQALIGTIGGGHLEFEAMAQARAILAVGAVTEPRRRFALGPSLGQCCGGVVGLDFALLGPADIPGLKARLADGEPRLPVALFGGGHVGRAIVRLLAELPVELQWFDSRDEIFPEPLPENVRAEYSDPVQAAVQDLAPGARVLIMSFSHAEDLDIVAACLQRRRGRGDLPFIGLIGSKSKWATFRHRLEARGFTAEELAGIICPIGVPGIGGKQPAVIAVAVAAQLLQQMQAPSP
ncbi:xanthine dehydrogenase accessory protein XdhC [Kinneretia asaccharophila]|uniref:Xanthine dehydrogenase accessory factor n=1 Tax=Roseateles asaccharophilus TaxID=582607 RepID=A0A4R6N734_9BURK|nr:xanthine dehydrogenase accessory protein XdhC [Roseateles asaccharophilus]MDN3546053.1 xanthine dehydrogenase accessory protein XdhC [Roseateles asaccharophilus]TDP11218.1 xanthine dehydrogenase accessory factor [Roseateles asaccharophilus]